MISLNFSTPVDFYNAVVCISIFASAILVAILVTLWVMLFGKGFK